MSEQVSFSAQVKVSSGPTVPISVSLAPGAYDKLSVTVPAGGAAKAAPVHVQPAAGLAQLLIVTASTYADGKDPSKTLAVEFGQLNSGSFAAISDSPIALEGPLVISGKGVLASIAQDWTMMRLTNNMSADASVDILVCRDV